MCTKVRPRSPSALLSSAPYTSRWRSINAQAITGQWCGPDQNRDVTRQDDEWKQIFYKLSLFLCLNSRKNVIKAAGHIRDGRICRFCQDQLWHDGFLHALTLDKPPLVAPLHWNKQVHGVGRKVAIGRSLGLECMVGLFLMHCMYFYK